MKQSIFLGLVILVVCAQVQASETESKRKYEESKKTSAQRQQQDQQQNRPTGDIDTEYRSPGLSDEELPPIMEVLYPQLVRPRPAQTEQQEQNQ